MGVSLVDMKIWVHNCHVWDPNGSTKGIGGEENANEAHKRNLVYLRYGYRSG